MSKRFFLLFSLLIAGFAGMMVDAVTSVPDEHITQVSRLTTLPGTALSVQYFEPRIRLYRDYATTFYPGMVPIDTMGFVYAK